LDIINSFAYLGFKGPIDLKNPEIQFGVLEDYGIDLHAASPPSTPYYIYFGRLVRTESITGLDVFGTYVIMQLLTRLDQEIVNLSKSSM